MFWHSYFDESGPNRQRPVMGMGGWVISPRSLKAFNRDWRAVLRKFHVREAHAAKLAAALEHRATKPSDFDGWGQAKAAEFRYGLNKAIDDHMRFGIYTGVVKADYKRVMSPYTSPTNPLEDPYRWLMTQSIEHLIIRSVQPVRGRLGPNDHVKVTFDAGHEKPGVTEQYFMTLTTDPTYQVAQAEKIVGGYTATHSINVPDLQAADHLVWGCNRGMEEVVKGLGVTGKVLGVGIFGLKRVQVVTGYWRADNLLAARKKLIGE